MMKKRSKEGQLFFPDKNTQLHQSVLIPVPFKGLYKNNLLALQPGGAAGWTGRGEGEGRKFSSRMCKKQSHRLQFRAEDVRSCLKAWWYFRKPLQKHKAVLFFFLECIFQRN